MRFMLNGLSETIKSFYKFNQAVKKSGERKKKNRRIDNDPGAQRHHIDNLLSILACEMIFQRFQVSVFPACASLQTGSQTAVSI